MSAPVFARALATKPADIMSVAVTLPLGGVSPTTLGGMGGEVHGMLARFGPLARPTAWSCPSICETASLERWRCSGICSGCHGCQSRAALDMSVPPPPPTAPHALAEFDPSALETASLDLLRSHHRALEENGSGETGGSWDPEGPPSAPPVLPPPPAPPALPTSQMPYTPPASPPPLAPASNTLSSPPDLPARAPPNFPSPTTPPPTAPPLPAQPPAPPPPAPIAIVSFGLLVAPAAAEAGSGSVGSGSVERRRRLAVSGSELHSAVLQAMQAIDDDFDQPFGAEDVDVDGPTSGDDGDTFAVNVTVHGAADPSGTAEQVAASVSSASFGATIASYLPEGHSATVTSAPTRTLTRTPTLALSQTRTRTRTRTLTLTLTR